MKLKTHINRTFKFNHDKFDRCTPLDLKKGVFFKLKFFSYNEKRRGGCNFRVKERFFLLDANKRKKNTLIYRVTTVFQYEKVIFRLIMTAPQIINISLERQKVFKLN